MSEWAHSVSQRAWSRPIVIADMISENRKGLFEHMETGDEEDADCWGKIKKRGFGRWQRYFKVKSC